MSSDPPRHGRRTLPRNYTFDFLMVRAAPRWTACGTHAHASRAVRLRFARRHDDPEVMVAICMNRQFISDDRPATVGLARHACMSSFRTNPVGSDEMEGRALTSPQSTAR